MADNFDFTPGTGATGSAEEEGGVLYPNIKLTASGTGTTEALSKAEDSAHTSGEHGIMALTVRQDTAAALSGTDADYQPLITNSDGRLHTMDANSTAIVTALEIIDDWDDANYCNVNLNVAGTDVSANAGVLTAQTLRVTIATNDECNNYLGTIDADTGAIKTAVEIIDNAISGTEMQVDVVAALPAGTNNIGDVDVLTIAAGDNNIGNVDIVTQPSDTFAADAQAYGKGVLCQGDDGTDRRAILVGTDGHVQVDVLSGGGGTEYTEDVATPATIVGLATMMERDDVIATLTPVAGDWASFRCSAEGALWVQDFNSDAALALLGTMDTDTGVIAGDTTSIDGKITACNTGAVVVSSGTITANLGATDNAVLDQIELNTDPLLVVGGGAEATAIRVTIANDSTGIITVDGTVTANLSATDNAVLDTIDAVLDTIDADTGAIKLATEIIDDWDATHDSVASADGPQLMGAYDSTKPTAVGDGDAVRVLADAYGRLLAGVEPTAFEAVYDSADATAEGKVVKASAASTIIVVQSYVISVDIEGWIKLQDEDSVAKTGKFWLKAGGGVALTLPDKAPIVLGVDKDLEVICEAVGNISVLVTGYTVPG